MILNVFKSANQIFNMNLSKSVILFTILGLTTLFSPSLSSQKTELLEFSMKWYTNDSVPGSMLIQRFGITNAINPVFHLFQDKRPFLHNKKIVKTRIIPLQTELVEIPEKIKSDIQNTEYIYSVDIS